MRLDYLSGAVHFRLDPETVSEVARSPKLAGRAAFAGGAMAKLDQTTAEQIRREAKHWPQKGRVRMFAMRYGVSERTISLILNDRMYAAAG